VYLGAVYQSRSCDYHDFDYQLHCWRTATDLEVDFVLYGERGLLAFEVKRTSRVGVQDLRALAAFRRDYPMAKAWLVYGGTRAYHEEGIDVVPFDACVRRLPELLAGEPRR
jgi:predicted AAA+ superfamily ATPase